MCERDSEIGRHSQSVCVCARETESARGRETAREGERVTERVTERVRERERERERAMYVLYRSVWQYNMSLLRVYNER